MTKLALLALLLIVSPVLSQDKKVVYEYGTATPNQKLLLVDWQATPRHEEVKGHLSISQFFDARNITLTQWDLTIIYSGSEHPFDVGYTELNRRGEIEMMSWCDNCFFLDALFRVWGEEKEAARMCNKVTKTCV